MRKRKWSIRIVPVRVVTMIFSFAALLAVSGAEPPLPYQRVAYDNAGVPGKQPHLLFGSGYRYPETDVVLSVVPADAPARTVAFGQSVSFSYQGLDPQAGYKARITYLSDGPREQRLFAGDQPLGHPVTLQKGPAVVSDVDIPGEAFAGGTLTLRFDRISGPNAVVSEIEVLSTVSTPLAAIKNRLQPTGKQKAEMEAELDRLRPRLTSRPLRVEGLQNPRIKLNGTWKFNPAPAEAFHQSPAAGEGWVDIRVPGEWVMQGFEVKPDTAAGYFRTFDLPADWQGQRIKLRFDNVYSFCRVWVNGVPVGEHEGGFVPFELDITEAVRPGSNTLALTVQNESMADVLASGTQYAAHQLGGIVRKVELHAVPNVHLADIRIETDLDADFRDALLRVNVVLVNESRQKAGALKLSAKVSPAGDRGTKVIAKTTESLPDLGPGEQMEYDLEIPVRQPRPWDPEHPHLYMLALNLNRGSRDLEAVEERFGFREIEVRENRIFVNGRPVKLHGVNRHEVHPLLGRALSREWWEKDARLFKEANCNFIRTCHYPPAEEFVSLCDEIGLFVELEAPLCWVGHGANAKWKKWDPGSERFFSRLLQVNLEAVWGYRNHPSVIIRSLANESGWTANFHKVAQYVALADPTRPISFHDQSWGTYNNRGSSRVPVANFHYPGSGGPQRVMNSERPLTFGEYCHLNTYNRREIVTDPGVRESYGYALKPMWDAMYRSVGCLGGSIWSGVDDVFLLPGGRAVGYGEWGPVDGWRRTKPEYWHIKKSYSPVQIPVRRLESSGTEGFYSVPFENRFNFTHLREIIVEWALASKKRSDEQGVKSLRWQRLAVGKGAKTVDIPPHETGHLNIPIPEDVREGNRLALRFSRPDGLVINEFLLELGSTQVTGSGEDPGEKIQRDGTVRLEENPETISVTADNSTYLISKETGRILSASRAGRTILAGGPNLMILPLQSGPCNTEHAKYIPPFNDTCQSWKAESVSMEKKDTEVLVKVEGVYAEARGGYTMRFTSDGTMTLSYRFESIKEVNPRQTGMVFDVDPSCGILAWNRRAFWTVYPEGHIGRPRGTASSRLHGRTYFNDRHPPDWPWAMDETELGSNDFKATRDNINWASLTNPDGHGVRIDSDGSQAFRSWIHEDGLRFLVAGFSTGGADIFLAKHYGGQRAPLKKGNIIEDTVRLTLTTK